MKNHKRALACLAGVILGNIIYAIIATQDFQGAFRVSYFQAVVYFTFRVAGCFKTGEEEKHE